MMAFCKHRVMDKCKKDGKPCIFSEECFEPEEKKPITNADHIRHLTDEALAVLLDAFCNTSECRAENGSVCPFYSDCAADVGFNWELWLKQPYKGEG